MNIFSKKTPQEKEYIKLDKQLRAFLGKRENKKESQLNRLLEDKVPEKLQGTLNEAFAGAFSLIFRKGTAVIEKTYRKDKLENDYQVGEYAAKVYKDKASLQAFSKKAKGAGVKNLLASGAAGIGMGAVGVGIPDIPVFTGFMLKSIYEIALSYGFKYDTKEEQYFILLLIQGAVSYGEQMKCIDNRVNSFIIDEKLPEGYDSKRHIKEAAASLSKELLYMKFLQGVPIVGMVGGAYDAVYIKRITEYSELKYRQRFFSAKRLTV